MSRLLGQTVSLVNVLFFLAGYPANEIGYPANETGYPANETGYPAGYLIPKKAGYPVQP